MAGKASPKPQQREPAADPFAFKNLIRSGKNPMVAIPVLLLSGGVEGFSLEGEDLASHPAGVRRLGAVWTRCERRSRTNPLWLPTNLAKGNPLGDNALSRDAWLEPVSKAYRWLGAMGNAIRAVQA
jgi:hypothetical protein